MSETRSVVVALAPGTDEEDHQAFIEEMESRDDVVMAKDFVINAKMEEDA